MRNSIFAIFAIFLGTLGAVPQAIASEQQAGPRAVTLWWVIFNNPEQCVSNPGSVEQCGELDLFGQAYLNSVGNGAPDPTLIIPNTAAAPGVVYATGGTTSRTGRIRLVASIYRTAQGGGLNLTGPSMVDPLGLGTGLENPNAEVHLVARDHGPQVVGDVATQITNFLEPYCSDPLLGWVAGDNLCVDVQFAVFAPSESGTDAVIGFANLAPVPLARATLVRNNDMIQAVFDTRIVSE